MAEAGHVASRIYAEARGRWDSTAVSSDRAERLVVAVVLLVALLLLSRGRRWVDSLPSRLSARASERSRAALVFGVSLGQIAIPMFGLILFASALVLSGLFDEWGLPLVMSLVGRACPSLPGCGWRGGCSRRPTPPSSRPCR